MDAPFLRRLLIYQRKTLLLQLQSSGMIGIALGQLLDETLPIYDFQALPVGNNLVSLAYLPESYVGAGAPGDDLEVNVGPIP